MVLHFFLLQIFITGTESNLGTVMAHLLVGKVKTRLVGTSNLTHYKIFSKILIFSIAFKISQSVLDLLDM